MDRRSLDRSTRRRIARRIDTALPRIWEAFWRDEAEEEERSTARAVMEAGAWVRGDLTGPDPAPGGSHPRPFTTPSHDVDKPPVESDQDPETLSWIEKPALYRQELPIPWGQKKISLASTLHPLHFSGLSRAARRRIFTEIGTTEVDPESSLTTEAIKQYDDPPMTTSEEGGAPIRDINGLSMSMLEIGALAKSGLL